MAGQEAAERVEESSGRSEWAVAVGVGLVSVLVLVFVKMRSAAALHFPGVIRDVGLGSKSGSAQHHDHGTTIKSG
jgi:hypothetical protein